MVEIKQKQNKTGQQKDGGGKKKGEVGIDSNYRASRDEALRSRTVEYTVISVCYIFSFFFFVVVVDVSLFIIVAVLRLGPQDK